MKNITRDREQYRNKLESFLDALDDEKSFFNLNLPRILSWETIMVEDKDDAVVAVAGVEKKLGIARNCLIIKKEYQGRGLGKQITLELIDEVKSKHDLIMAVISKDNKASIKMHSALGYRLIGRRQELSYFILPISKKGVLLRFLMKSLFPFVKIIDLVRR